jgi:serine/threonine protein kinase
MKPQEASSRPPAAADEAPPAGSEDPRIAQVMEEYLSALEAGERPRPEAFAARYPDLVPELIRALEGLEFLRNAASQMHRSVAGGEPDGGDAGEPDPLAGRPLGDFRIIREVGRGGMGVVYEAVQLSLGRRVALKVLPFAATLDPRQLQRFHNEARAAAGLHHPHIVPVHAVGCERGVHYYAMQFIDGQTLASVVEDRRSRRGDRGSPATADAPTAEARAPGQPTAPLDRRSSIVDPPSSFFRRAAEWGIQAAEALEHAHSLGIVHRDVKPANLIVDAWGKLWVTDFGLARTATDAGLTMTGDVLGTLRYMSPEQALARHGLVDHRTDVYSLGATLYELLTGQPAVAGQDRQHILKRIADEEPQPPRTIDREVPVDLETVVLKALAKDPAERYATARELADDLRRFLEHRPIQARRPSAAQVASKWVRRHHGAVLAAGAVLFVAVVALAISAVLIWLEKERTALALQEKQDALARAEQQQGRARGDFAKALNLLPGGLEKLAAEEGAESPQMVHVREVLIAHMEEFFRQYLKERPDDPFVRLETAWAYDHLGCYHWQHGHLARSVRAHQTAVAIMSERAAQFAANAEYLETRSGNYWRLACALYRAGKWREGRDAYRTHLEYQRRCAQLEPARWDRLDFLASTLNHCPYEELRDPEEALRLARWARSLEPPGATSLDTLGMAYYRAGNLEEALVTLQQALPLRQPTVASITFYLILVRVKRGECEEARRLYDEEVERLRKRFAQTGRLRTDAALEILWAEAAAALGLEDPAPVPRLDK